MTVKTHTGSSLYFIAMIPDAEIEQQLHGFKLELFEKYQCKAALKSPAHITLIPPFAWANHQDKEILNYFNRYQPEINSFEMTIDGFDTFGSQVFYAKPLYEEKLYQLQTSIRQYFEPILKDKLKNKFRFHPHITIANRDMKAEDLPQIMEDFSLRNYNVVSPMRSISLLKHNGSKWDILSEITL